MVLSCLGSGYLLFIGIMVAIDASIIHFHPESRATSATVFIVAALLYGAIFGGIMFTKKSQEQKSKDFQKWVRNREGGNSGFVEMVEQNNWLNINFTTSSLTNN